MQGSNSIKQRKVFFLFSWIETISSCLVGYIDYKFNITMMLFFSILNKGVEIINICDKVEK